MCSGHTPKENRWSTYNLQSSSARVPTSQLYAVATIKHPLEHESNQHGRSAQANDTSHLSQQVPAVRTSRSTVLVAVQPTMTTFPNTRQTVRLTCWQSSRNYLQSCWQGIYCISILCCGQCCFVCDCDGVGERSAQHDSGLVNSLGDV